MKTWSGGRSPCSAHPSLEADDDDDKAARRTTLLRQLLKGAGVLLGLRRSRLAHEEES